MAAPSHTRVRITDVSPRDGLQNEPGTIPTADKSRLIHLLRAANVDEIEATSFVSPKWVPQLADAEALLASLSPADFSNGPMLSVLVPNEKGLHRLLEINSKSPLVHKASVFTAASETFSRRNTNASIAEALERFKPVVALANANRLHLRGYLSCVIACPFEGPIAPAAVAHWAEQLHALGIPEIDLGDTIGAGTPDSVTAMLAAVHSAVGASAQITLHLHDTFGRAADCVKAALQAGIRSFDGSAAGLGGCPYASTPTSRAPGNISTETLVRTVHDAGFTTGVHIPALREAAAFAAGIALRARAPSGTTS